MERGMGATVNQFRMQDPTRNIPARKWSGSRRKVQQFGNQVPMKEAFGPARGTRADLRRAGFQESSFVTGEIYGVTGGALVVTVSTYRHYGKRCKTADMGSSPAARPPPLSSQRRRHYGSSLSSSLRLLRWSETTSIPFFRTSSIKARRAR